MNFFQYYIIKLRNKTVIKTQNTSKKMIIMIFIFQILINNMYMHININIYMYTIYNVLCICIIHNMKYININIKYKLYIYRFATKSGIFLISTIKNCQFFYVHFGTPSNPEKPLFFTQNFDSTL